MKVMKTNHPLDLNNEISRLLLECMISRIIADTYRCGQTLERNNRMLEDLAKTLKASNDKAAKKGGK